MATEVEEDDDMGLNDRTQAVNKRGRRRRGNCRENESLGHRIVNEL